MDEICLVVCRSFVAPFALHSLWVFICLYQRTANTLKKKLIWNSRRKWLCNMNCWFMNHGFECDEDDYYYFSCPRSTWYQSHHIWFTYLCFFSFSFLTSRFFLLLGLFFVSLHSFLRFAECVWRWLNEIRLIIFQITVQLVFIIIHYTAKSHQPTESASNWLFEIDWSTYRESRSIFDKYIYFFFIFGQIDDKHEI